jgi:hypothetical protein
VASETLDAIREFLFPNRFVRRSIAPLDAGLTPNDRLEELDGDFVQTLDEPDDVLLDGPDVYVTSGQDVVRFDRTGRREIVATLPGQVGPLVQEGPGRFLVGVAGHGVWRICHEVGTVPLVDSAGGEALHCPTDLAVVGDSLYVTDGSTAHHGDEWVHDLMAQHRLGRLVRVDLATGDATVLRAGLAWPAGVTVGADGSQLVVTEAWTHRILGVSLTGGSGDVVLRENLPGYPGRLSTATDRTYWLAMFALRTQLVDFVLTQRDYVAEMTGTIEPEYWIRPALRSLNSGLEPLQGGQIRKLGIVKPWAPPRSYGLVVRLDAEGTPLESLHSRGGGSRHGVTSVREFGERLAVAIRGGRQVVVTDAGRQS